MKTNNTQAEKIKTAINEIGITVPETQFIEVSEVSNKNAVIDSDIKEMNDFFAKRYSIYKDVLAPELKENEKLKRTHKTELMKNIFKLLNIQFVFTYIFVLILIVTTIFSNFLNISEEIVVQIFSFSRFYITSIVAELIAILFFIVKSVFDKSIVDLFKNFDKDNKDIKADIKEQD